MARKSTGRRCPACGSEVATLHKFCTHCGIWLDPDRVDRGPGTLNRLLGTLLIGLLALVVIAGVAIRFFSSDTPSPTPIVDIAASAASPRSPTEAAPTRTPVRPQPTATERIDPTRTPNAVPTHTSTTAPEMTVLAALHTSVATKPVRTADVFAPTETSIPRNPTRVSTPTEVPARIVEPPAQPDAVFLTPSPTVHTLTATDCSGYDAWEWAQSVYDSDPSGFAGLDPDGDGRACPELGHGFAPAFWMNGLPAGVEIGTVAYLVDGDTYEIVVDGQSSRYRLYHADTPETHDPVECGGAAATDFVRYVLAFSDTPQQVWIESTGQRDKYGRKLAYIWITIGGDPYLLNHALINNGWAEDIDYRDEFNPYTSELHAAAVFAQQHRLGVWSQCGGFGVPATNS